MSTDRALSVRALWQAAMAATDDPDEREQVWLRSMIANGYHRGIVAMEVACHRVLSRHARDEVCKNCPCHHCGTYQSDPDGDHSCPCPYHDNDCPWHPSPTVGKGSPHAGDPA